MHGITITEVSAGTRSLVTVATAVIGMVATAPDADAAVFPLDRPALMAYMTDLLAHPPRDMRGALTAWAAEHNIDLA